MMNRKDFVNYAQKGWGKDKPMTQVCMGVNASACTAVFEQTMMGNWLPL